MALTQALCRESLVASFIDRFVDRNSLACMGFDKAQGRVARDKAYL